MSAYVNAKKSLLKLSICAVIALLGVSQTEGQVINSTGPTGLTGTSTALPGDEVLIYTVGLLDGNPLKQNNLGTPNLGPPTRPGIEITISDLTPPTGLVAADFTGLNLYKSPDNVLDGGDTQVLNNVTAVVGGVTTLDVTGFATGSAQRSIPTTETFFFITAVIAPTATPGHTFRVEAADNHIGIQEANNCGFPCGAPDYSIAGATIAANDGNAIIIGDGSGNTSSSFLNGQAGGGRGIPFGGEPVMLVLLIGTGLYMIRRQLV